MASEDTNEDNFVNEIYMVDEKNYSTFIHQHEAQLKANNIPVNFWKPLCLKLQNQIFDAGNFFSMVYNENEEDRDINSSLIDVVVSTDLIDPRDGNNIYLIDHAWTYSACEAKAHLEQVTGLVDRMVKLMNLSAESEHLVEDVYKQMWKFNQTYSCSLSNRPIEDQLPVWYVMDEFGSAIQHSDNPNFRVVPFLNLSEGIAYSLLFPLQSVCKGNMVTRDYVEGYSGDIERRCRLVPWTSNSLRDISYDLNEPPEDYFLSSRRNETLPNLNELIPKNTNGAVFDPKPLRVFSQYSYVNEYLTSPKFTLVSQEEDADVLWLTTHFKEFKELSEAYPTKFINQFPFECVITIKDLLAIICRRRTSDQSQNQLIPEPHPSWLPITYNLITELPKFVSYFQHRQDEGLDNFWICKPWNLARGMDTLITDDLNCIIRLSSSGPKIAQKYIQDPVLFYREGIGHVKFDVRYVILLKSTQPLEVFLYKNFFLRFANKPFELNDFDDYEKHFTVMNYNENSVLHRLLCADFIQEFDLQYPETKWCEIELKIISMFDQVFKAATMKTPPCGIGESPQSRALYAADLMLSKTDQGDFEPKLLEINWTPDCQRACEYYPNFYNDIFELLFLDEEKDVFRRIG